MDTNLIFKFRAVFESGTIAKAAEQVAITPGALSRSIKRLENELGVKLFNQSGRNITATDEAKKFYVSSSEIIKSIEYAKDSLLNITPSKSVRISTFEVFSTHFTAWMIDKQKLDFPITLFESTPGKIESDILNNISDFGLTYIPELHSELDHLFIGKMPFKVFKSKSSKSKGNLPFTIPITKLSINHLQMKSLDGWPSDIPRNVKYQFEMLETALDLSSRGKCKILCPEFITKIENQRLLDRYKLIEDKSKIKLPTYKIYAIKKKSRTETHEFKKICKAIRLVLEL